MRTSMTYACRWITNPLYQGHLYFHEDGYCEYIDFSLLRYYVSAGELLFTGFNRNIVVTRA